MQGQGNEELYPDIGDLTPQELAERNTFGYVPSRGETAPANGFPRALPPVAPPQGVNYAALFDEMVTALAAISRQLSSIASILRAKERGGQASEAASQPFKPAPRARAAAGKGVEWISSVETAARLHCSVGHVGRIRGLVSELRNGRRYFTKESVLAMAERRGAE